MDPRQRQVLDVAGVDLPERAEAPARVVAVVRRPGLGSRPCADTKTGAGETKAANANAKLVVFT
jgi:hypothetical protein